MTARSRTSFARGGRIATDRRAVVDFDGHKGKGVVESGNKSNLENHANTSGASWRSGISTTDNRRINMNLNIKNFVSKAAVAFGCKESDICPYKAKWTSRVAVHVLVNSCGVDGKSVAEAFDVSESRISTALRFVKKHLAQGDEDYVRGVNALVSAMDAGDVADDSPGEQAQRPEAPEEEVRIVCGTVLSSDPDAGVEILLRGGGLGWIPPRNLGGDNVVRRSRLTMGFRPGRFLRLGVEGVDAETGRLILRCVSSRILEQQRGVRRSRFCRRSSGRVPLESFDFVAVDAANVVGIVDTDDLRSVILEALDARIRAIGKVPVFFVETSMLRWLRRNHPNAYRSVQEFANDTTKCVLCESRVQCDRELIAFLEAHKNAVAVTRDGYRNHGISPDAAGRIFGATFIAAIPGLPPTVQLSWLGESIELA